MVARYNIAYKFSSQSEYLEIEKQLVKLGYLAEFPSDANTEYIMTLFGQNKSMIGPGSEADVLRGNRAIIDNLDTFLALASMWDDTEFHEWEWVKLVSTGRNHTSENYTIDNLYQLGGPHFGDNMGKGFYTVADDKGRPNGSLTYLFQKATMQEIISYFNRKDKGMARSIIITGSTPLKIGMMAALQEMGIRANGHRSEDNIKAGKNIVFKNTTPDDFYGSMHTDVHNTAYKEYEIFTLPEDWNAAIAAIQKARIKPSVQLTIGSNNTLVEISEKGVQARGYAFNMTAIEDYAKSFDKPRTRVAEAYSMTTSPDVRFIKIGCDSENNLFSINELNTVINEYKKFKS